MKKHLSLLLASTFLLTSAIPAHGNYREDFVYQGHYLFLRRTITLGPSVATLGTLGSVLSGTSQSQQPGSPSFYESSDLPEWDFDIFGGGSLVDVDQFGAGTNNTFEADVTSYHVGVNARKDRLSMQGIFHMTEVDGEGVNGSGRDSDEYGFTFMPGYRVWNQEENGVNVDVAAILDLSQNDVNFQPNAGNNDKGWYFRPGVKAVVNRMTEAGLFQGTYAFNQLSNIDGDRDQFTGKSDINSHAAAFDYICMINEQVFGNVGISHIELDDAPAGMDDQLTDVNIRVGTVRTERFNISGGFFQSIDGRDTNGFNLQAVWGLM